jgi:8-oxo-dGTP diphosphatase
VETTLDRLWQRGLRMAFLGMRVYWWALRPTERSAHVALWHEGRVLLVKSSYRAGYGLPAGGARRREPSHEAAARELLEETGVELSPEALRKVDEYVDRSEYKADHGDLFEIEVTHEPTLRIDRREVIWAGFRTRVEALALPISPATRHYLERSDR